MFAKAIKKIMGAALPFAGAMACHCFANPELVKQVAESVGASEELVTEMGSAFFMVSSHSLIHKFSEATHELGSDHNHDFEKTIRNAYKETFEALEQELIKEYQTKESKAEFLSRLLLKKENQNYLAIESLYTDFLNPLYSNLTDGIAIQKMLKEHLNLNPEEYLNCIIEESVPEYIDKNSKAKRDFVMDISQRFQRLFSHHFLQEIKNDDKAKTVYFTSLLEDNLRLGIKNEKLLLRIIAEIGIDDARLSGHSIDLVILINEMNVSIEKQLSALKKAIVNNTEPYLRHNDYSKEINKNAANQLFNYKFQYTNFTGRSVEKSFLLDFIFGEREQHKFKWWMITGPGGMGKSRLAFEAAKIARALGYNAGFYDLNDSNQHDWNHWIASKPTFIVIDYALSDIESTKELIVKLQSRSHLFNNSVRVLLLERQISKEWENTIKNPEIFISRYNQADATNSFELIPLAKNLWNIVAQIIEGSELDNEKKTKIQNNKVELLQTLLKIDPLQRPLYGLLAGQAIVYTNGDNLISWNANKLHDYHLTRLEEEYWKKIKGYSNCETGLKKLLAVNTFVRKLNQDELIKTVHYLKLDEEIVEKVYPAIATESKDENILIFEGLEPDILGEYFIIKTFNDIAYRKILQGPKKADDLLNFAWNLKPQQFLETAFKGWFDFYKSRNNDNGNYNFEFVFSEQIRSSENRDAKYWLVDYFQQKGFSRDNFEEGIKDFNLAIEIDTINAGTYYNRALWLEYFGKHQDAINDYSKAIDINPQFADAYNNRGSIKYRNYISTFTKSDYDKELEKWELLKKDAPLDIVEYIGRKIWLLKEHDGMRLKWVEPIKDYDIAIKINPVDPDYYYNRGLANIRIDSREEAIIDFSKAIEVNPKYIAAYYFRGLTLQHQFRINDALTDYDKVLELDSAYPNWEFPETHNYRNICLVTLDNMKRTGRIKYHIEIQKEASKFYEWVVNWIRTNSDLLA